jgi:hypothetical protein
MPAIESRAGRAPTEKSTQAPGDSVGAGLARDRSNLAYLGDAAIPPPLYRAALLSISSARARR